MHIPLVPALAAAAVVLAACSSTTSGTGSGASSLPASSARSSAPSSAPSSLPSSAPSSDTTGGGTSGGTSTGGGGNGGGTTTGGGHTGGSGHPSTSASSSAPTADNAVITSFTGTPHCTDRSDTHGTVSLSWTSGGGATTAYIVESAVAIGGSDGQGSSPALPANGSTTLPFDCAQDYDYYTLYVHAATTKNGETLQVANTTPVSSPSS
ncbi:MAG: hypothetical protein ACTHMS_22520 [Jatrophihabitans sp.]|uniref:hypothetical protein n=1 Tax=Jatrophihabitans sp. TaxID=1932789 RepID=UPI003F7E4A82